MATSNSTDFEPNVTEFIEEAYERCGLELRTGYDLKTAIRSVNLMLAEWANRGLNQWTIEQATQTVTQGTNEYTLNANIIDILDVVVRRTVNNVQTDISISRVGRSEYLNIPNKETQSRPTQYFLDKSIIPILKVWPAPENSTDILVSNNIDMPFRFYPCFVAGLSYYLSLKKAPQLTPQLKALYEEEFRRAADQDEDRASFRIRPSIRMH
mgnify:CR=1 FL=1